jgi:lysophospholipase L1-like esterase
MRNSTFIIAMAILLPALTTAQTKYRVVVLGSSTAYGVGATVPDSSWVGRTKIYYKSTHQLDTLINLAVGGSFTDSGVKLLPTALGYNPDIVLVNFPSNDLVAGLGVPLYMSNLRKMYNTVTAAGKRCFISTTQPRSDLYAGAALKAGRDSVLKEFPSSYMQFYDPLVIPGTYDPNPLYVVDGTHPNNTGHRLLFQAVVASQAIPVPLPLVLTGFSGHRTEQGVVLDWSASNTDGSMDFFIERSADGTVYQNISHMEGISDGMTRPYSYTDQYAAAGPSFYRIRTVTNGNATMYSNVISLNAPSAMLAIQRIYITGGNSGITTTIGIPRDESLCLAIFNTAGTRVKQQFYTGQAPAITLEIPLPSLPAGIYFLQITTSDGQRTTKSFDLMR